MASSGTAPQADDEAPVTPSTYQRPEIHLVSDPVQRGVARVESSTRSGNFFRNAKWCPDGSCILTQEEDRLAKIFALPPELAEVTGTDEVLYIGSRVSQTLKPYLSLPQAPAALLGMEWYPFATSQRPETFCFVRSVRDVPVALVDGFTGKIRASYSIIDHQERFIGPQCMTFSLDGTKLYCGFENALECFDVATPGNTGTRFSTSLSRKSREGQKGLISSIAIAPDGSGLMVAGSYSRSLCLYDASGSQPRLLRSLKTKDKTLKGSGVTQVRFHPTSPELVYAASRCSNHILVWDVRNTKDVILTHPRRGNTNQRIHFDIDPWGKWLTTGDTNGNVHFFDTHDPDGSEPVKSYKLANDTVSSASLHPYLPYLLTTDGSRPLQAAASWTTASDTASESESESDSRSQSESDPGTDGSQNPSGGQSALQNNTAILEGTVSVTRKTASITSSQETAVRTVPPSSDTGSTSKTAIWHLR